MKDSLLNRFSQKIKRVSKKLFYYFCFLFPIKKNRIICDNFCGNAFNDNPKYVVDELLKSNSKLEIYWAFNNKNYNSFLPKQVKRVKYNSFKYFFILATSKVWIDNVRMPFRIKKRTKQFYLQTWHGGLGFKKIEKDAIDTLPSSYINSSIYDSKNMDLLVSNSKWLTNYFKKYFWYDGEIITEGLPRNDALIDTKKHQDIINRFHKEFSIDNDTKIVLYAPTFRNTDNLDCYNIDFDRLVDSLKEKFACNWKVLLRLHPNMTNNFIECNNVINVSSYPVLNDILISSDILISDYSSIVFDYSYLSKPIFLFAADLDSYKKERGFIIDYDSLPFPIAKNNDELINNILNFDKTDYLNKTDLFFSKFELNETGNSSARIANIILDFIKK